MTRPSPLASSTSAAAASVPSPASAQAARLSGELRIALGKLNRRLREQARSGDFTSSQRSVLLRLDRDGPATVSALARAESMRPQSMRVTVASLEALGAVTGSPDPADGRQTLIALTATFHARLQASRAVREDWLCRALDAQLTADEQHALAAIVPLLQRLAEY